MNKCKLSEFKKHCLQAFPEGYHVRISYCLDLTFSSIEICFLPDAICLKDDHGNWLNIHGIREIEREGNHFMINSDYFGEVAHIDIEVL